MKIAVPCSTCTIQGNYTQVALVTPRDDGRYETTCELGHKSVTLLTEQHFEVLYEIGAHAIVDNYYREAVSSFTSSLERFYEYFIKAALFEKGIDENVIFDCWKSVASQSERQLGAFIFIYTSDFAEKPPLLSNSRVKFRNAVIHKGKIPSREEAVTYGQAVLDVIRELLEKAKERYPVGVERNQFHHAKQSYGDGGQTSAMTIPTIISTTYMAPDRAKRSLEEALKTLIRL